MARSRRLGVGIGALLALAACGSPPHREARSTSGGEVAAHEESRQTEAPPGDATTTTSTGDSYGFELDASDADADAQDYEASQPAPMVEPQSQPSVASDETLSLSVGGSAGSTDTYDIPNIGFPATREPSPLVLVGYALVPSVPTRVLLATLELPPGERFVPPVSSCQDTLMYLASGTLDASGTGIASVDSPATLYAGDAVRFGPEGDGLVINTSSETVRTLVALARSEDGGPARIALEERGDRVLCPSHGTSDPLSQPQRVASFATSPPLVVDDGALEVRILLDADAAGAEHAGLAVLTGSATFAVPEHVHDGAAEILYFEDGRGTMHVGDRDVEVAPGVSVYVPEGTPHSFEPSGSRSMRALQFYAPSGPEQRFRGMSGG